MQFCVNTLKIYLQKSYYKLILALQHYNLQYELKIYIFIEIYFTLKGPYTPGRISRATKIYTK